MTGKVDLEALNRITDLVFKHKPKKSKAVKKAKKRIKKIQKMVKKAATLE